MVVVYHNKMEREKKRGEVEGENPPGKVK